MHHAESTVCSWESLGWWVFILTLELWDVKGDRICKWARRKVWIHTLSISHLWPLLLLVFTLSLYRIVSNHSRLKLLFKFLLCEYVCMYVLSRSSEWDEFGEVLVVERFTQYLVCGSCWVSDLSVEVAEKWDRGWWEKQGVTSGPALTLSDIGDFIVIYIFGHPENNRTGLRDGRGVKLCHIGEPSELEGWADIGMERWILCNSRIWLVLREGIGESGVSFRERLKLSFAWMCVWGGWEMIQKGWN